MGLKYHAISAQDLIRSPAARLDPRHYSQLDAVAEFISDLLAPITIGRIGTITNGLNLPRSTYADDSSDVSAYYASVAPISTYYFRKQAAVPLDVDVDTGRISGTRFLVERARAQADEVLIVRSRASAPGLAWPVDAANFGEPVVPAGFLLRLKLGDDYLASYVAAILNHPVWRLLTAAFAAGKSQDNLSQETLAAIPFPKASRDAQGEIANRYQRFLAEVERLYLEDSAFLNTCDQVLNETLGLKPTRHPESRLLVNYITGAQLTAARLVRLDNRWHSIANVAVRNSLGEVPTVNLGSLLIGLPSKGRQPTWVDEDVEDAPFAIATSALQSGSIASDQVKSTTLMAIERFPVEAGQLLVAMDGDGSLGKAAVYDGPSTTTVDSHVARCRTRKIPGIAAALSCYLNSSWGRTQTEALMTGATGQTQLSAADLCSVIVPTAVVDQATRVALAYEEARNAFEPLGRKARRLLSEAAADVGEVLLDDGSMTQATTIEKWRDRSLLFELLSTIYSSART